MDGATTKLRLIDGRTFTITGSWQDLVHRLTEKSLTGSAVALVDRKVQTVDGGLVRFGDIVSYEPL